MSEVEMLRRRIGYYCRVLFAWRRGWREEGGRMEDGEGRMMDVDDDDQSNQQ